MPRRDGTGPIAGRGLGVCAGASTIKESRTLTAVRRGLGLAYRHGCGRRGFGRCFEGNRTQKEVLEEQKAVLQDRLEVINRRLENL